MELTPHQRAACMWLVDALTAGQSPVALRGYAGSGKTTMIPALRAALQAAGFPVAVGSPTHRAAMILRSKGIADATTVHALALTPYFLPSYAEAFNSLLPQDSEESPCPTRIFYEAPRDMVPELIQVALLKPGAYVTSYVELKHLASKYGPRRALEAIGLHGRNYFDGFGPKLGDGVLIIDEASMVGEDMLRLCQEAFTRICLVGDPGQLPPVNDVAVLATVEGVDLTEVHRQAADSPIIQLATAARQGAADYRALQETPGQLERAIHAEASAFLDAPLIVWRNAVRLNCTIAIRNALGYPPSHPIPGEPLVCRATSMADRAEGFVNNALYRVVERQAEDGLLAIQPLGDPETTPLLVKAHMEELDGERIAPGRVPFRFGYCLTAHTAQGGEWPTVYIAQRELLAYTGKAKQSLSPAEQASGLQWAYTAITRARSRLIFLQDYVFKPPSEALLPGNMVAPLPTHDDKESTMPEVPTSVMAHEAPVTESSIPSSTPEQPVTGAGSVDPNTPAGQAVITIDQALFQMSQHAASVFARFASDAKAVLAGIDGAWQHILQRVQTDTQAIAGLTQAVEHHSSGIPYAAAVTACTPSGRPIRFTAQAATWEGLLTQMGNILALVNQDGWSAPGVTTAPPPPLSVAQPSFLQAPVTPTARPAFMGAPVGAGASIPGNGMVEDDDIPF